MRFPNTVYARRHNLPAWGLALSQQIERGGEQAPADVLGPVTALRDLMTTALAVQAGRGPRSDDDRSSLREDLRLAFEELGPSTATAVAPVAGRIRAQLGRVPSLLQSAAGATRLVALAETALAELGRPDVLDAGWSDVERAYREDAQAKVCELRVKQLAEVYELRGGDFKSAGQLIGGILRDDPYSLAAVGAVEGPPDVDNRHESAGFTLEDRLAHARAHVLKEPPVGDLTGWVCFSNASLPNVYMNIEGIELFGHQLWPECIRDGSPTTGAARSEFGEDKWHKLYFDHLPDEPFVLVSIPLGQGPIRGAVENARNIANDLVRAARPHSEWRLTTGAAIHAAGRERGWFGIPIQKRERPEWDRFSPQYEPTGQGLAELPEGFAGRLLAGDEQVHQAVRDIAWAESVAKIPDTAQELALSLRLVERTLVPLGDERWTEPVRANVKDWWAEQELREFVADVARGSVAYLEEPIPVLGQSTPWRERLMPWTTESSILRLDETMRAARDLSDELDEGTMQAREANLLAERAASADAWTEALKDERRRFDVLLDRAARVRNAVIHGADTVPEVVESVSYFVARVSSMLMHLQLDAAKAGESAAAKLERNRLRLYRVEARLASGTPPVEAIFKPTDEAA